ncbi:MAG TPA: hypothetical protein VMD30_03475 [Tepidisphaeraceae bacterium]|nr:hypothetical protein [Tepidisphaeraceae bacterium]
MKKTLLSIGTVLSLLLICSATASGQEVVSGQLSVASLSKLEQFFSDLGLENPIDIRAYVENSPLTGPGSMDTERPFGFFLIRGEDLIGNVTPLWAFPLVQGKATIDQWKALRVPMADGRDDTAVIRLEGGKLRYLKRTDGYVFTHDNTPDVLDGMTDQPFDVDYDASPFLASSTLDLATVRDADPGKFEQLVEQCAAVKSQPTGNAWVDGAAELTSMKIAYAMKSLDHVQLVAAWQDQTLILGMKVDPCSVPEPTQTFPRPTFPADVDEEAHWIMTDPSVRNWIFGLPDMGSELFPSASPEMRERLAALTRQLVSLCFSGDAESVATSISEERSVVYCVSQYSRPIDFCARMNRWVAEVNAASSNGEVFAISQRQDRHGWTIYQLGAGDTTLAYCQVGQKVFITLATDGQDYMQEMLDLPTRGEISALGTGIVHANSASLYGGLFSGPLNDRQQADLAAMNGDSVQWLVRSRPDDGALDVTVQLPQSVARGMIQIIEDKDSQ